MQRPWVYVIGVGTLLICFFVFVLQISRNPAPVSVDNDRVKEAVFNTSFGISSRAFKLGIAGYSPAGYPNSSSAQTQSYWKDIGTYSDIYGVHVDWKNMGLLDVAIGSISEDIVLVVGFQDPVEWDNQADSSQLLLNLKDVLARHRRVKYLGIGNEVNDLATLHPGDFSNFVSAYRRIYDELKRSFPEVMIFPTFQLETLKGEGYLTGKAVLNEPQWQLFEELEPIMDMAVVTTYPYFDYETPNAIPDDYFSEIFEHTSKPFAISETGWISRETFTEREQSLVDAGLGSSVLEQREYLLRLIALIHPLNTRFVNWLFLNDPEDWQLPENAAGNLSLIFDSAGLRYNDGSAKPVFELWQEAQTLPTN